MPGGLPSAATRLALAPALAPRAQAAPATAAAPTGWTGGRRARVKYLAEAVFYPEAFSYY